MTTESQNIETGARLPLVDSGPVIMFPVQQRNY
jgi:hypothetical protein